MAYDRNGRVKMDNVFSRCCRYIICRKLSILTRSRDYTGHGRLRLSSWRSSSEGVRRCSAGESRHSEIRSMTSAFSTSASVSINNELSTAYLEPLLAGDRVSCRKLIDQALGVGIAATDLLNQLVWPTM